MLSDPPLKSQHPNNDFILDELLKFNCSITLDTKAAVKDGRPEIYWKSDSAQLKSQKISSELGYGVKVSYVLFCSFSHNHGRMFKAILQPEGYIFTHSLWVGYCYKELMDGSLNPEIKIGRIS